MTNVLIDNDLLLFDGQDKRLSLETTILLISSRIASKNRLLVFLCPYLEEQKYYGELRQMACLVSTIHKVVGYYG